MTEKYLEKEKILVTSIFPPNMFSRKAFLMALQNTVSSIKNTILFGKRVTKKKQSYYKPFSHVLDYNCINPSI